MLRKIKLVTVAALVAIALAGVFSYLYVSKWLFPMLPARRVGELATVVGRVESVTQEPYTIKIVLRVLSVERRSPRFQVGDAIAITFSGIGAVSSWRASSLKESDVVRCEIRWVEDAYWEATDDGWNYSR